MTTLTTTAGPTLPAGPAEQEADPELPAGQVGEHQDHQAEDISQEVRQTGLKWAISGSRSFLFFPFLLMRTNQH